MNTQRERERERKKDEHWNESQNKYDQISFEDAIKSPDQ